MNSVNKIIFLHIPKTGGTGVTKHLSRFFQADKVYQGRTMLDYLKMKPEHLVNYDFLRGHIFYHYIGSNPEFANYQLITLLRHPVERVISLYRFWRSHPQGFINDEAIHSAIRSRVALAKSLSLCEFVFSREKIIRNSICNSQSRQLSSSLIFESFHEQRNEVIFQDVTDSLAQFSVIGLIEFLPPFYMELQQRFGFDVPDEIIVSNVSDKKEQLWSSVEEHRKISEKISELNEIDLMLYEHYRKKQINRINQKFINRLV